MELLVAYKGDPAGYNMAKFLLKKMVPDGNLYHGDLYDLLIIDTPVISADWLEEKYKYDGFIFLSKHYAESGTLALTCHSTGNFSTAQFGGKDSQVAIPHPFIQKEYMQTLWANKSQYPEFDITIEATHHGPTALTKPTIFIEIGTSEKQWTDISLCNSIASLIHQVLEKKLKETPVAICFGGTHYPGKFNSQLIIGDYSLGTVMPKHSLDHLNKDLFNHILNQNKNAQVVLLDWDGLGPNKKKILDLLDKTDFEVIKI